MFIAASKEHWRKCTRKEWDRRNRLCKYSHLFRNDSTWKFKEIWISAFWRIKNCSRKIRFRIIVSRFCYFSDICRNIRRNLSFIIELMSDRKHQLRWAKIKTMHTVKNKASNCAPISHKMLSAMFRRQKRGLISFSLKAWLDREIVKPWLYPISRS